MRKEGRVLGTQLGEREGVKREVADLNRCRTMGNEVRAV